MVATRCICCNRQQIEPGPTEIRLVICDKCAIHLDDPKWPVKVTISYPPFVFKEDKR